jgi:hypothetical protein
MANGRAYEVETTQDVNFALKGYVQLVVGRTYRATAVVRQSVTPSSLAATQIEMAFYGMDFSFASTPISSVTTVPAVAAGAIVQAHDYDGWITVGVDIKITAANLAAWARPYVIARANTGSKIQIKSFKFEDVSVASAAEGSAKAASDFASSASTFADAAGNAAAQASSSATLSASVGTGSMLLNPTFSAYGNTDYADSWSFSDRAGDAPVRVLGKVTPFAMTLSAAAGANSWVSQDIPAAKSLVSVNQWCVIEADLTLAAGTLDGAGILFRVYGGTTEDITLKFAQDVTSSGAVVGSGTVGQTYTYRKLVQVTQATGAGFRVYAMAHWGSLGSTATANTLVFHRVSVRPANQGEIEARVATKNIVDLTSTVTQQSGVIADLGGRTKAYWNLGLNAGANSAAFITASAETSPGVTTSNVSIGAQEFHIYNQSISGWSKALSVVNNEVQIFGRLQIASVSADRLYSTGNAASDALPATLGVGGTSDTLGSVTSTANTVSSGTLKYRTGGAPTNAPVATGIAVTQNTNGTMNVRVSWDAYTQGTNQADFLMLFWTKSNGLPTINDASITMNVNIASGAYYVFEGVNPQDVYSFGIAAARRTESGSEIGSIVSPTSAPSWRNVGNTTPSFTANINGIAASTVTTNAASGATAFTGTAKYRTAGAPTNNPAPSGVTLTQNTNGSSNIRLDWSSYVQGANQADTLVIFWRKDGTAPTVTDSAITCNVNTTGSSYYVFEGVNPADTYSFGIAAARRTESGLEVGSIQSPASAPTWKAIGNTTPNFTANINGVAANTVTTNAAQGSTAFTATAKYRTAGAPTNSATPTGLTVTQNNNGTMNVRLDWSVYTQGTNQADFLMVFWTKANALPTLSDTSITVNVNTTAASYYVFEGVSPQDIYSFGIAAVRRTENGLEISTIVSPTASPNWRNIGNITPNYSANIGGTSAGTVATGAAGGATALAGTANYRTTGVPTNNAVPAGVTVTTNTNGTLNIRLDWAAYVQGAKQADTLILFWRKDGTVPTFTDSSVTMNVNTVGASYYVLEGVNPADTYSFGISAARRTENGLEEGVIVSPTATPNWRAIGNQTANYTANIGGSTASTVVSNSTSGATAFTGTVNYRTTGAPTTIPTPAGIVVTTNTNGTINVRLDWAAYTQGVNQADHILIFWRKDGNAPGVNDSSIVCNVTATASYYVFEGINPADTYSFAIAAARRTEMGLEVGSLQSPSSAPTWRGVGNTTPNFTANLNGVAANTVTTNAGNGALAFSGTAQYRTAGSPTTVPTPSALTITQNTNGTSNIRLDWSSYAQGSKQADTLVIFWRKDGTAPTVTDSAITCNVNTAGASYYVFEGVNPQDIYSFGIAAARRTENGLEVGTIATPTATPNWRNIGNVTPNYTANIGGTTASTVTTGAAAGTTAAAGTVNYRNTGVPTNNAVPSGITVTTNTNGTLNLRLDWAAYVQGAKQADSLVIFWRKDGTLPTFNDSSVTVNVSTGASYYIFEGVNPADTYSFGISAARRTENGLEEGPIVSPTATPNWRSVGNQTVNFTGNINGSTAATVTSNAANGATAFTGTSKYRTAGAPTNAPAPTGITLVTNTNATTNIRLDWAAYTQGVNQADNLIIFWRKDGTTPTVNDASIVCNVSSAASYYVFEGVNPADTYSFGIAAARRTETGLEIGTIVSPGSAPTWRAVGNSTVNYTANIGGAVASTVVSGAASGATAFSGTANYRTTGSPTNNPTPSSVTITQNTNGTSNIRLDWSSYVQGAKQADTLVIFWRKDGSAPTVTDSAITCNVNSTGASYYVFEGVNPADTYSFGIAAARRTETGLEIGTIQAPTATPNWRGIGNVTPNYTANVGGSTATALVTNAGNGATAFTGTLNYRTTGAPTNNIAPSGLTIATNSNGTINITITWAAYVQGAASADTLVIFWRKDGNSPLVTDSAITCNVNTTGPSYYSFEGVNPKDLYSFGVAAARRTENGLEVGTIVTSASAPSWKGVGNMTPNFTANIGGSDAATVVSNAALGASDPATRINTGTTTIDPGKIVISGTTLLSDWRNGTDTTTIEGGKIAANTISANKLTIGTRGIDISGLEFTSNWNGTATTLNRLYWSAGAIIYTDTYGVVQKVNLPNPGFADYTSGTTYIYWVPGNAALSVTTAETTAYSSNTVVLATYAGGTNMNVTYGRTIIDGSQITTGTIDANRLKVNSILSNTITVGGVSGSNTLADAFNRASYASVSGTPTTLAAINSTEGTKLTGIAAGATVGATSGTNLYDGSGAVLSDSAIKNSAANYNARVYYGMETAPAFSSSGATMATANGVLTVTATTADPNFTTPILGIAGSDIPLIRIRARPLSASPTFEGAIYYATTTRGVSGSYRHVISSPGLVQNQWQIFEWDMSQQSSGAPDYVNSIIQNIRVDLAFSQQNWEVDWIAFGAPVAAGSYVGGTLASSIEAQTIAATAAITAVASDNVLAIGEKGDILMEKARIDQSWTNLSARADAMGISRVALNLAYSNLNTYLGTLSPAWNNVSTNTPIDGPTFRSKFTDFYTAESALASATTGAAATTATWVNVTGTNRPADNATQNRIYNQLAEPTGVVDGDQWVYPVADNYPSDLSGTSLPATVTISRATTGTRTNANGVVVTEAVNAPRFDYDASKARTNYILNSEFNGWVVGSPGSRVGTSGGSGAGMSVDLVNVGSDAGGRYADIRYYGTNSSSSSIAYNIVYTQGGTPAVEGQVWTASASFELIAGSTDGLNSRSPMAALLRICKADGTYMSEVTGTIVSGGARSTATGTMAATVGLVQSGFYLATAPSGVVDITIRYRQPQLEISATATAYIPTTGSIGSIIDQAPRGLLDEQIATNLNLTSSNSAAWTLVNTTRVISDFLDPTGVVAWKYANTVGQPSRVLMGHTTIPNNTQITRSFYVKLISGSFLIYAENNPGNGSYQNASFNLKTGTCTAGGGSSATITAMAAGWWLCTVTVTTSSTGSPNFSVLYLDAYGSAGATQVLAIACPQLEAGPIRTSYIPTVSAVASRAADNVLINVGSFGLPDGSATVKYTFDNATAQTASSPVSGGRLTIPTLNRPWVTNATATVSKTVTRSRVGGSWVDAATVGAPAGTFVGSMAAESVVNTITNIASDNILSTNEKGDLIKEFARISANKDSLVGRGAALLVSTTAFVATFTALNAYLTGLSPAWNDTAQNTPIDGPTFRSKFNDYYTSESATASSLTAAAATLATWTGVSGAGRPSDNATSDINLYAAAGSSVTVLGNSVWKPSGASAWDTFIMSKESFVNGSAISFTLQVGAALALVGLCEAAPTAAQVSSNFTHGALNFAVYRNATTSWQAYENGAPAFTFGALFNGVTFSESTVWTIAYDGVSVKYYADGILMRTVTAVAGKRYFAGMALGTARTSAVVNNIRFTTYTDNTWASVGGANKPADNATVGAPSGTNVGTMSADDLVNSVTAVASDNVLSTNEKGDIIKEFDRITKNKDSLVARGAALQTSTTSLVTAFNALNSYLSGLTPAWNLVTANTTIDGPTFRTKFSDYYAQESTTASALTAAAATLASWAGVTGVNKPADNATVGAPAGTYVGTMLSQDIVSNIISVTSDNILSINEKSSVIAEYTRIQQSATALISGGQSLGISTTNIGTALNALGSYLTGLTPVWNDITKDTPIDGPTFRTKFTDFYTQESSMTANISATAATKAVWNSVTGANKAADNATVGAPVGTYVGTMKAEDLVASIGAIASDSVLSTSEKGDIVIENNRIGQSNTALVSRGNALGVGTSPLTTAYNALQSYLNGLTPSWNDVTANTNIDGPTFRQKFTDFYTQESAVLSSITAAAATLASWSGVTGANRPADNATVGAPAGTYVGTMLSEDVVTNIANIASDNVLSTNEKGDLIKEWSRISQSNNALTTRGSALSLSTTALSAAYTALQTYINGLSPAWNLVTANTVIDGPTFRSKFADFYSQESTMLSAITAAAAKLASWDGVTGAGRPADYATSGESIIIDQDFSLSRVSGIGTYWTGGGAQVSIDPTAGLNGTPALKIVSNSTVLDVLPPNFTSCVEGDVFYIQGQVFVSNDFVGSTGSLFSASSLNAAGVYGYPGSDIGNINTKGAWVTVNGKMTMGAGAIKFKPRLSIRNDSTAGYVLVNYVTYQRVQKGATVGAPTGTSVGTMLAQDVSSNITNITSDNVVSKGAEKSNLISLYNTVGAAYTAAYNASLGYSAKGGADLTATDRTAATTAMNALTAYLNGLSSWSNVAVDTAIVGATLRTLVNTASTTTQNLVKSNAVAAATTVTSYNNRSQRNADVIPSVLPVSKDGLKATLNSDGSADVAINWVWVGDQTKIDGFEVTVHVGPKGGGRSSLNKIANSFFDGD